MAKNLVIVESPAKAKTIKKFLGANYEVIASNGHVRDLPKSQMGVDVEHGFEPKYITIRGKGDILAKLRKEVKKADRVYLATDPDREGEAISWHLSQALKLEEEKYKRITFHEITKQAVKNSIKNAREIDMNLVDAQQARRMLDRMVGYQISPILWAKIKRGLSAGRVQSVALRLICDRENEINAFIPEEYWTLDAILQAEGMTKPFTAKYAGEISNKEELEAIVKKLEGAAFAVREVKEGKRVVKAPSPFTTSTLQQEASKKLNYSTQKTMRLAQQLYEGIDIKGKGTVGLITYLRTDSIRIAEEAQAAARDYIEAHYGKNYVGEARGSLKNGKRIQDAHEAIRPTDVTLSPVLAKESLGRDLFRLYQLIYNRFLASQMQNAVYETTSLKLEAAGERFTASASRLGFDGFLSVYKGEEEKQPQLSLTGITPGSRLKLKNLEEKQHFTQPPAHYTEALLVKTLEELGIGRPSTYAPTITTIMNRRYIVKEQKNLYVTELGEAVNQMMLKAFPVIVDVEFTANMESLLDSVEEGTVAWKTIIENFYPDLDEAVQNAELELEHVKIEDEVTDVDCDLCGRKMVIKYGPHGKFLACPGFPDCRNTKPYYEKIGVACPNCGKDIVLRKTKKGRRYYGCEDNPACDFMSWQKPSATPCPNCGGIMVEKGNKLVCMKEDCSYIIDK
ncbi:MAG: type I DNA topoisomerase [Bacteroides sp.]|nr:type I DNA topoisomerase [Bacteroides sp.]MCM1550002.1 type I DNA topoisomerase [Clostridium sp.]